jgi:hypothetical protein
MADSDFRTRIRKGWLKVIKELIEKVGGTEAVAKSLTQEGASIRPIDFAVEWLGGIAETARLLGMSRQHLHELLKDRPPIEWKGVYIQKLIELTRIPVELLWKEMPPAQERKRGGKGAHCAGNE